MRKGERIVHRAFIPTCFDRARDVGATRLSTASNLTGWTWTHMPGDMNVLHQNTI